MLFYICFYIGQLGLWIVIEKNNINYKCLDMENYVILSNDFCCLYFMEYPSNINLSKDSKPRTHLSLIILWNWQLICAQYYFTLSKCPFKISLSAVPDVQIKHLIYLAWSSCMI